MVVIGGSIVAVMALARQAPAPTGPLPSAGPTASLASDGVVPPATAGITFPDFTVNTEVVRSPTTSTAQSKLWFAQGRWWGALFGPTTNRLGIFALDPQTQVWADTGTLIDERPIADADVLWDGSHLYVVSGGSRPSENHAIRMRRFTYDAGTKRYAMDPDFPVTIRPTGASPAVLAMDSTDVLWVAYAADDKVWLSHTLEQATLWSPPLALAPPEATITPADVASVIAFGPGRIGVAWTNQRSGAHFSVHEDGAPDDAWSAAEPILPGPLPDDQLNLATYPLANGDTSVAAAVSTTHDQAAGGRSLDPLTLLATRDDKGDWSTSVVGLVRDRHARPIVLVDPTGGTIAVAATSPGSGGAIYYKRSPLDRIEFDTGEGVPLISSTTAPTVDNVTSSKGPFTVESGMIVLANDRTNGRYVHSVVDLGAGPPTADPADPSRPKQPTPAPAKTSMTLLRDTFEPWPTGPTAPPGWSTRPEDPPDRLSVIADSPGSQSMRLASAGADVRACRDFPEIPGAALTVRARIRLTRVALDDATILSVRGSGGETASIRVTNKQVLAWFDGATKIRSTATLPTGRFFIVTATIDQEHKTYDLRVTTDAGAAVASASALDWRMSAVETVRSVCIETPPALPTQAIVVSEVSVSQDAMP